MLRIGVPSAGATVPVTFTLGSRKQCASLASPLLMFSAIER